MMLLLISLSLAESSPCLDKFTADTPVGCLTDRERAIYSKEVAKLNTTCRDATACLASKHQALFEYFDAKRRIEDYSYSVTSRLLDLCPADHTDITARSTCLVSLSKLRRKDALALAGMTPSGVTRDGYHKIEIGMRLEDVEYLLGASGDQEARSSVGGYSTSAYSWSDGLGGHITVVFNDYEVAAKSKLGF